ncbi:MAG: hypothetical protein QM786_06600 [Breznakibacter sp.]
MIPRKATQRREHQNLTAYVSGGGVTLGTDAGALQIGYLSVGFGAMMLHVFLALTARSFVNEKDMFVNAGFSDFYILYHVVLLGCPMGPTTCIYP